MTDMAFLICRFIYAHAAATPVTGDRPRWPDVLAFRWPVNNLVTLTGLVFDADLAGTVLGAEQQATPNDRAALENVIVAAIDEQCRRQTAPAVAVPAGS